MIAFQSLGPANLTVKYLRRVGDGVRGEGGEGGGNGSGTRGTCKDIYKLLLSVLRWPGLFARQ